MLLNADLTNNMTIFTKCASVEKITIESMVNVKFQLPVVQTHTGMVPDVNAKLDSSSKMADVFSLPTQSQSAQPMPDSTESLVFAKLDFTKFQDTFARDVLMVKFGTVPNATGTPLAQVDSSGTLNTEDAMPKLFNALKMLNGTVLCVCAIQVSIWLVLFVLDAHQTLLGMEETATPKSQLALVVLMKFLSTANVFVKTVSTWSKMFVSGAQKEPHGTEDTVLAHKLATGVWVSLTLWLLADVLALLDLSN